MSFVGAGNEIRTRDPQLGKLSVFSDLARDYLSFRLAQGCQSRAYTHLTHWSRVLGNQTLSEISSRDIIYWLGRHTEDRGWSPQTRLHAINCLSGFFRWAVREGLVPANPVDRVPRPRVRNERRFVISKDQLTKLLAALPEHIRDLVLVAARTGLRFGKLVSLMPSDLHQDEQGDWFLEVLDKNGEVHRAYLYGSVLEICRRRALEGSQWLFTGCRGGRLTQKSVRYHLIPAAKVAGLVWGRGRYDFSFHSLRRAFATHLLNSGASIEDVMAAGNWKSFEAVKRYAYLSGQRRKASFKQINDLLQD